ncbi:MAG: hypothetical protein ABFQ62_02880 [Patescibacteria group bacterium]
MKFKLIFKERPGLPNEVDFPSSGEGSPVAIFHSLVSGLLSLGDENAGVTSILLKSEVDDFELALLAAGSYPESFFNDSKNEISHFFGVCQEFVWRLIQT